MPAEYVKYDTTGTADIDVSDLEILQDVVVVDPVVEETSKGGIVIADVGDAQKVRWGVVVAHGPGRIHEHGQFVPVTVKVGQTVGFGAYQTGGEPIKMNGTRYLLFRMGDFWCSRKSKPKLVA